MAHNTFSNSGVVPWQLDPRVLLQAFHAADPPKKENRQDFSCRLDRV